MGDLAKDYHESMFQKYGMAAQRRYPNEELCRFMGRHFFTLSPAEKSQKKILELGCGTGANLWMTAREGLDSYGIDISAKAVELCHEMLGSWGTKAKLQEMCMTDLDYPDEYFDAVLDIFSTFCLDMENFEICLKHVARVLKARGKFFSYTPSAGSAAFTNYQPSKKIDEYTLSGITRKDSAYSGSNHPFRFLNKDLCEKQLAIHGLKVTYLETTSRTYNHMGEYFEFIIFEAEKI
jgi:ubiquinone/menaquinone biosynthesis C-methylase UbiE